MRMRRRHRKQDEETTYWLSYSDMMAGLLLTFVLIIALTSLHASVRYDQKQEELSAKTVALDDEKTTVLAQQAILDKQAAALSDQAEKLKAQADQLATQESVVDEQKAALSAQQQQLAAQHELLDQLQAAMAAQQEQLDNIIGVRQDLIQALKKEFEDSDLSIEVDEKTGAIAMDSSVLFELNKSELKDSGKEFLDAFLPRYVSILLAPEYRDYVSEIMIEGHTDTQGTYLFNLSLSQERAYSVAEYCLSDTNNVLTKEQKSALEGVLAADGRSYSSPVLDEDGEVDADASRRVEILFRLKDEEMIRKMVEILNSEAKEEEE